MDVDEMIGRLLAMKDDYGNAKVEVRNPAGDFDEASAISATHYGIHDALRWIVFIDV